MIHDRISGNGQRGSNSDGVGVYLYAEGSGNKVASDVIQGNTGYGIFLYNSAGNLGAVARTGPEANANRGNGIADFREYTGPATAKTTSSASAPKSRK